MKFYYKIFINILFIFHASHSKILKNCQFFQTFYQTYSNIFELNNNQTLLTIRPLYSLSNQTFSSAIINQTYSIGIIYRFVDTYLVPIPLLFQCENHKEVFTPNDCEFTIFDTRSDLSVRTSESTRTTTVPLQFFDSYSLKSYSLRGAYFKQSKILLKNCRYISNETYFLSNIYHLHIQFEQTIGTKCSEKCLHSQLYECSSLTKTCQCRTRTMEKSNQLCIDTELTTNCSLTQERCQRLCHLQNYIDHNCQCPLGTQRILLKNKYHCQLPKIGECDTNISLLCPKDFICRDNRCIQAIVPIRINQSILSAPVILISLLVGALFIIIILIIGLLKMRSVKCVKFVHPQNIVVNHSNHSSPATITRLSTVPSSSSPCSTLSSSSKSGPLPSTNKILEKYTKIHLFE